LDATAELSAGLMVLAQQEHHRGLLCYRGSVDGYREQFAGAPRSD
jgi:hypothetical protein